MSHFLFVVEIPPAEPGLVSMPARNVSGQWQTFQQETQSKKTLASNSKQLCSNVWLLEAKNALPALVELTNLAQKNGLQTTSYLFSGDAIELAPRIKATES